jgi:hypothetical protein
LAARASAFAAFSAALSSGALHTSRDHAGEGVAAGVLFGAGAAGHPALLAPDVVAQGTPTDQRALELSVVARGELALGGGRATGGEDLVVAGLQVGLGQLVRDDRVIQTTFTLLGLDGLGIGAPGGVLGGHFLVGTVRTSRP